ncbi:MAG TPA: threonine synthase [Spirochaetaceae bacterium]|nr:threonine synthase [Spirochaetaceae bacterium]
MSGYRCSSCGKSYSLDALLPHCSCGGLFDIEHAGPAFNLELVDKDEWSMFRYRRFMPLDNELWRDLSLGEGLSPTVRLDERTLVKMDYMMPTLSFKDRGAAALIWLCKTIGVRKVAQDSSGNAGNAVAAYCARAGIACEIFVPEATSPKKIAMIRAHGASVTIVRGTRDQTADACREKVAREGLYYASHVYNPFFYEGTKTYLYEIFEQRKALPANLVIPLGNGTLFLGVMKALAELKSAGAIARYPRIYAVQSERCAPFKAAVEGGLSSVPAVDITQTMAEGIAIGRPMRGEAILKLIYEHGVRVITAKEDSIAAAREYLARMGIYAEHTSAANFAAYQELMAGTEAPEGDTIIPVCGAGLKSDK